jgi:hypothetical protein
MTALSDYAEKLLLDWLMTPATVTRPTSWRIALFTAPPSDAGGGTEVSGGGYARQPVTFAPASAPDGTTTNTALIAFTATANWGTITHIGLFDAATAGNLLWHGPLSTARTITTGDRLEFATGAITLTLA